MFYVVFFFCLLAHFCDIKKNYFSSGFSIKALTFSTFVFGMVLEIIVMVLCCDPFFPSLSKVTLMLPFSPGRTGSLVHSGTVQPQLPEALLISNSPSPVFLN